MPNYITSLLLLLSFLFLTVHLSPSLFIPLISLHFFLPTSSSGTGISHAILSRTLSNADSEPHETPRVIHVFTRSKPPLPSTSFVVGESVAVTPLSPPKWTNYIAIGVGTVKEVGPKGVELILDR